MSRKLDEEDEAKLDDWVEAKRARDFTTADSLREELRAKGIDPEYERPSRPQAGDPKVEKMLDDWVEAKREKDFSTADNIRSDLRKWGIDPDRERPPGWDKARQQASGARGGRGGGGHGRDPWIEDQLDRWVEAKRARDYRTADDIRDDLRKMGIDPDLARPAGGKSSSASGIGIPTGWGPVHNMPVVTYAPMPIGGRGYGPSFGPTSFHNPGRSDAWVEQKLDRWVEAKRNKDFGAADAIRDELRRIGVDADARRPPAHKLSHDDVERELDNWVEAKRNRDFRTADQIRDRLRKLGVEPDTERPPGENVKRELQPHEIDAELDKWVEAKRARDFGRADSIRKRLREVGVDPDDARPPAVPRERRLSRSEIEDKLDAWVNAKRGKDFETADSIRDELRELGIEPDRERPSQHAMQHRPVVDVERMLDDWVEAKRARDFQRADKIRSHLRDMNIDPDQARPAMGRGPSPIDIERQLDSWVEAKRARDFAAADAIRDQLRALGVEPDRERPPGGSGGRQAHGDVDRMLDDWVDAKRAKDFGTADSLRQRLRQLGVDPEVARPAGGSPGAKRSRLY